MIKKIPFESYLKRIAGLQAFKNLPKAEIERRAKKLYDKKYGKVSNISDGEFTENEIGIWLNLKEAEKALNKYNSYKKNRDFTDYSDDVLLKRLVKTEIEIERVELDINKKRLQNKDQKEVFVPTYALKAVNDLTTQCLTLKKSLGLTEEQKTVDPLKYINQLKKKFKKWRENNQGSRHLICPWCIAEGTKILMADFSTKNIENVQIGDEILAIKKVEWHHKKRTSRLVKSKVLNKFNQGKKETIKIKVNDKELILTPDHKILYRYRNNFNWRKICKSWGEEAKYLEFFENETIYLLGSLKGFIDAEGHFNKYNALYIRQIDEIDYVLNLLNYFSIEYNLSKVNQNKASFSGKEFIYQIYIPKKELEKYNFEQWDNKDFLNGYLAGMIMGDGSISSRHFVIYQKKDKIIEQIEKVLNKLNIRYSASEGNNKVKRFVFNLLSISFYCPKGVKFKKYFDYISKLSITSLKSSIIKFINFDKKQVWDLQTVEENFIANGFIVHNCSKMIMLKIRTDAWEAQKHPFFKDKILANDRLWQLWREGTITKKDIAKILEVSTFYVNWLEEKIYQPQEERKKLDEIKESGD